MTADAEIRLEALCKHYGATVAVHEVSLSIEKGELVALLGPSGCGKTTTLRMIAGFVEPTSGRIHVQGRDITRLPPYRRDTGMVFQNYALFPHLTVAENIAFGLARRGLERGLIRTRVGEMVSMMRLQGLEDRLPQRLSGGQQQRVAVARALVINPTVLLLDEPFSNLDAKLRESTRVELRRIQHSLGLTSIFVTHDQQEAMAIADRIAVMDGGRVVQVGRAADIYERPASRFVAEFIGQASFLSGRITSIDHNGDHHFAGAAGEAITVPANRCDAGLAADQPCTLMLRPEGLFWSSPGSAQSLSGTVDELSYQGPFVHVDIRLADGQHVLMEHRSAAGPAPGRGEAVGVRIDAGAARIFSGATIP
jgi:ABC-type Fe3+/spermidine/putrescine transport system ATPase subunit